ncbi:MAG: hypothetical protein ACFFDI_29645 [Promethearchaeota archaeon]
MLLYCNKCAEDNNYQITNTKEAGTCELCGQRLGKMNIMEDEEIYQYIKTESDISVNLGDFKVKQIRGFVPGTVIEKLHPGMRRIILGPGKFLFQAPNELILATNDGKQIQIKF